MAQADLRRRISITEAAQVLGIDHQTVRRMISRGELPAYRIGAGPRAPIRLDIEDVERCARPMNTAR